VIGKRINRMLMTQVSYVPFSEPDALAGHWPQVDALTRLTAKTCKKGGPPPLPLSISAFFLETIP
jgi:hypothetical protein